VPISRTWAQGALDPEQALGNYGAYQEGHNISAVFNTDFQLCEVRGVGPMQLRCLSTSRSHRRRVINPLETSKISQPSPLHLLAFAGSRTSGSEFRRVSRWEVRCTPTKEELDQAREELDVFICNRPGLKYKHTLYPQRMMGVLRDPHYFQGEPVPPSRGLGIHTAHIFLGNDPLMNEGCNIMRARVTRKVE
jgi:hypothetical protein